MGYLGRRIGKSQDTGNSDPASKTDVGGGILDLFANGYFQREGKLYNAPGVQELGVVATGGVISEYTSGSDVFRAHIFTNSGELAVTDLGTLGAKADFVVVGGGGAGGSDPGNNGAAAGGGAGGYRSSLPEGPGGPSPSAESQLTLSVQTYTVTVGGGGAATSTRGVPGSPGNPSIFSTITSQGGGGGGAAYVSTGPFNGNGRPGGSGGGAGSQSTNTQIAGTGSRTIPGTPAPNQGYPGGLGHNSSVGTNNMRSGGGGGAGGAGFRANPPVSPSDANGAGGSGKTSTISGTSTNYAGGGTASNDSDQVPISNNPGAPYGGGSSENIGASRVGTAGKYATGGGGCGNGFDADPSPTGLGGTGGSGVVIVRYKIGTLETQDAKATGGAISFYGGKTIHTFTGSGTFATKSNWSSATVEYVVVGGGGGGGIDGFGGGGGAGAYRTGTTPIGAHPVSTTIQVGGGGIGNRSIQNPLPAGYQGTPSYFGTPITSPGGGGGGVDDSASPFPSSTPGEQGMPGGSGGGNSLDTSGLPSGGPATGAPFPGTIGATPPAGWGHPGGKGSRSPIGGAGGGGAGGAGASPSGNLAGGAGIQLPTTFRDPAQTIGAPGPTSAPTPNGFDTSGKYWVAGGGAGGGPSPSYSPTDGAASSGGGGYYSTPSSSTNPNEMIAAVQNTGSGGGAGSVDNPGGQFAGASGVVIIAYPT